MDGLLMDSEPLWRKGEIKAFGEVGVKLTEKMCNQTMGLGLKDVVEHWYQRFPWEGVSKEEMAERNMEYVSALIKTEGQPRLGVKHILDFVKKKKVPVALATSSYFKIIDAVMERMQIRDYFDFIHSAELEKHSKPHPSIYMNTAKSLKKYQENCLVFEDSFLGLLAAKAANMKCVSVPDESLRGSPKLGIADLVITTLDEFTEEHWQQLNN